MKYEKKIILKNGVACLLKTPELKDAEVFMNIRKEITSQTPYMSREVEEVESDIEKERKFLEEVYKTPKFIIIGAYIDDKLIGSAACMPMPHNFIRYRHRAEFAMGIHKDYWGYGIGSVLLKSTIECAKEAEYKQIELEVVTTNEKAILLYKKYGFEIYGTRERAMWYKDGTFLDEHLMMLKL